MKITTTVLCLSLLAFNQAKAQIFINIPSGTSNSDPTYRVGNVMIGSDKTPVEKLDVNGNIVIPSGNFLGISNSGFSYRKFLQAQLSEGSSSLNFYTPGNQTSDQNKKMTLTSEGFFGIGVESPKYPLEVSGNAAISGTMRANSLFTSAISFGVSSEDIRISSVTTPLEAKVLVFGSIATNPFPTNMPCVPQFVTGDVRMNRITITNQSTVVNNINYLDVRNDGTYGYIDYAHNKSGTEQQQRTANPNNTVWPTLKVNSSCNGNVELSQGGGVVSTGNLFEVGFPNRDFTVRSNIYADGTSTGLKITSVHPTVQVPGMTYYNTKLMVNTALTHAIAVLNTSSNAAGDELFAVHGNGKVQVNATVQTDNYLLVKDISTPSTPVDGFALTGKGYIRMNTPATAQVNTAINVHDITNNVDLFRVNTDGHVYAREVEIKATSMAFPDYVFAKDYKRLSLPELDQFIAANKHLPGFEKAEHYEANGIKASEMFVKQQETIENLTLYIIELEKRLKALEEASK